MSEFRTAVCGVVRTILCGQTLTYGEVARRAGYPGAARAVGTVLRANHDPSVPCHRVVRSDGTVGEYNRGGPDVKRRLLAYEARSQAQRKRGTT